MKVLIVDDSKTIRTQVAKTLNEAKMGYESYQAENGMEALEILEKVQGMDIIVSDISMPEMDGMELAKVLKGRQDLKNVEIVFFTTECCLLMKLEAKELGVRAWLPKPAKPDLLLGMMEKIRSKFCIKKEVTA